MAPVAGQPFLHYLLPYLKKEGCTRVILSLGHGHRAVLDWLGASPPPVPVDWVVEEEPLGTGGGIRLALEAAREEMVCVLNGDTFFDVPLALLQSFTADAEVETALALKPLRQSFDRYGTVEIQDRTGHVVRFAEKAPRDTGLINGGVYSMRREAFLARPMSQKFSFEKDYLEAVIEEGVLGALPCEGYFIDIGVPEDYARAQHDFAGSV